MDLYKKIFIFYINNVQILLSLLFIGTAFFSIPVAISNEKTLLLFLWFAKVFYEAIFYLVIYIQERYPSASVMQATILRLREQWPKVIAAEFIWQLFSYSLFFIGIFFLACGIVFKTIFLLIGLILAIFFSYKGFLVMAQLRLISPDVVLRETPLLESIKTITRLTKPQLKKMAKIFFILQVTAIAIEAIAFKFLKVILPAVHKLPLTIQHYLCLEIALPFTIYSLITNLGTYKIYMKLIETEQETDSSLEQGNYQRE